MSAALAGAIVKEAVGVYAGSEHAKESMDAVKRGGAVANYSCQVIIEDLDGNIERVYYGSPQDGEWKRTPAPIRGGSVSAHL